MKTQNKQTTHKLVSKFDKELMNILLGDLKKVKKQNG